MKRPLVIVYSNMGLGGIPRQIVDIVNTMSDEHKQTDIYLLIKEKRSFDIRGDIRNPRVKIFDFYQTCPYDSGVLFICWTWYFIYLLNPATILSFISPYAITVLVTKILFFWRRTTIVINEAHFTSTMISTMIFPTIQRWGIRVFYPIADTIIVPTKAIYDDLSITFSIPTDRLTTIHNWSRYARSRLTKRSRPYDIIYMGRIEKSKNILDLIQICQSIIHTSLPTLRCLLVGEGTEKDACLEYIRTHNLENNITVKEPIINISHLLKSAKIFVFSPNQKTEGFPISLLDAISLGTLVITKDFTGLREVLDSSNSIIVETSDGLSKNIVVVLAHFKQFHKKILNAKALAKQRYSILNASKYIQLFNV